MNRLIIISIWCIVLCGIWWTFSAFQKEEELKPQVTKDDLISAAVQDRIKIFTKNRKRICAEERLADAVFRVDSILIQRAKAQRDTVSKPPKPFKPDRPEILILEDTTPIAPILITEKDSL
jgi:hypothetical protein